MTRLWSLNPSHPGASHTCTHLPWYMSFTALRKKVVPLLSRMNASPMHPHNPLPGNHHHDHCLIQPKTYDHVAIL